MKITESHCSFTVPHCSSILKLCYVSIFFLFDEELNLYAVFWHNFLLSPRRFISDLHQEFMNFLLGPYPSMVPAFYASPTMHDSMNGYHQPPNMFSSPWGRLPQSRIRGMDQSARIEPLSPDSTESNNNEGKKNNAWGPLFGHFFSVKLKLQTSTVSYKS